MNVSTITSSLLPLAAFIISTHLGWLPWMIVDRTEYQKQQMELTQRRQAEPRKMTTDYQNSLEAKDRPGTKPAGWGSLLDQ